MDSQDMLILALSLAILCSTSDLQAGTLPLSQAIAAEESLLDQDLPASADQPGEHITVVLNDSVEKYIAYFTTTAKHSFQRWLDNSARYLPVIREIFSKENLPQDLAYVPLIESGFNPQAISRARAAGIWQIMPQTARHYGLKTDWWRDERKDVVKSTRTAARHLRDLHNRLQSWPLVLAAYNAGSGKIQRAMTRTGSEDFWDLKDSSHIRRETKNFVPKFMAAVLIARNPGAYGFQPPPAAPAYDEIAIWESMDLRLAAFYAGTTYRAIKKMNPEIVGRYTPPDALGYVLKIPEGTRSLFVARSRAVQKATLQLPAPEIGRTSLQRVINQRDSWVNQDPCSALKRAQESAWPERTARVWTGIEDHQNVASRDSDMTEKILAACVFEEKSPQTTTGTTLNLLQTAGRAMQ